MAKAIKGEDLQPKFHPTIPQQQFKTCTTSQDFVWAPRVPFFLHLRNLPNTQIFLLLALVFAWGSFSSLPENGHCCNKLLLYNTQCPKQALSNFANFVNFPIGTNPPDGLHADVKTVVKL